MFILKNIEYSAQEQKILLLEHLTIAQGDHTLLIGPSGCGKTTLLNVLAGLLKPTKGEVHFNDKPYSSLSTKKLDDLRAKNFGFVFQKLHLIQHLNVEQNIAIASPDKSNLQNIPAILDDLGLENKGHKKARDLSHGEAQRVAIARAIINNPKVIFADEPSSALDDANAGRVLDLLFTQAKKQGATIIAATHDTRIISHFNSVLDMAE